MKKYKNAFSRLRCSSHRLEIDSGRWHRPVRKPNDERKCRNCNVIENEFHFLFECSLYNDLRLQYIDSYFYENPNHFKRFVLLRRAISPKVNYEKVKFSNCVFLQ